MKSAAVVAGVAIEVPPSLRNPDDFWKNQEVISKGPQSWKRSKGLKKISEN